MAVSVQIEGILREYAAKIIRFYETGYECRRDADPQSCMVAGFVIEGGFGVGDRFFEAMRALRAENNELRRDDA